MRATLIQVPTYNGMYRFLGSKTMNSRYASMELKVIENEGLLPRFTYAHEGAVGGKDFCTSASTWLARVSE